MTQAAKISVFDLESLTFKTFGRRPRSLCGPSDVIQSLESWTQGRNLGDTRHRLSTGENCYCFGIHSSQGQGVIISLWHESPAVDGRVLFATEDVAVGKFKVQSEDVPDRTIPGVPSYFWIHGNWAHVSAVSFEGRRAPIGKLRGFLRLFMSLSCDLVSATVDWDEEEARVEGMSYDPGDGSGEVRCRPSVVLERATSPGIASMRAGLSGVRSVMRKDEISREQVARSLWSGLFGYHQDRMPETSRVLHQIQTPEGISKELFDSLVELYRAESVPDGVGALKDSGVERVLDIGFRRSNGDVQWLSQNKVNSRHDLAVRERDGVIRSLPELAQELSRRERQILDGRDT